MDYYRGVDKYRVEIKVENSVLIWAEPFGCDGSDFMIIKETSCQVPITTLLDEPFSIGSGEFFTLRVMVITDEEENIYLTQNNAVAMPVEP